MFFHVFLLFLKNTLLNICIVLKTVASLYQQVRTTLFTNIKTLFKMSTSAIISIRTFDEATQEYKCKSAYLSHDGYIAGNKFAAGEMLLKHYNTPELAQGLVDLGGMRAIGETADKCEVLQGYQPVENVGRDAVTTYAHIEFKYIFNTDVNAWFVWFQFPKDHKAEFIRLDYIVKNFVDGVYQSPK